MKDLLKDCATIFDRCPLPIGITHITLDDEGNPTDMVFEYVNPSIEAMLGMKKEDVIGHGAYEMWGGDRIWLDYYYDAAYNGVTREFEAPSELLERFLRASAFPIKYGYCGYVLQDVTDFVSPTFKSLEGSRAGVFFYDTHLQRMKMTASVRAVSYFESDYVSAYDFVNCLFEPEDAQAFLEKLSSLVYSDEPFEFERKGKHHKWFRIYLSRVGSTNEFAYGFLEDITEIKRIEERNERYFEVIDVLSRENFALYVCDPVANTIETYAGKGWFSDYEQGIWPLPLTYDQSITRYLERVINAEDRKSVGDALNREALLKWLEGSEEEFSLGYRCLMEKEEQYVELRVVRLYHDRNKVIMAARNATKEMREHMRQREVLENALSFAEHASNAKSIFLANMSHDFRTPMNAISGFASIALDNLNDTKRVGDCLEKILTSSEHLLNLVNDILDMSRVESGKISVVEEPINLHAMSDMVDRMFSEEAAQKNIAVAVDTHEIENPYVMTDPLRMSQIVTNIVGNSLKYTPEGGEVYIHASQDKKAYRGYRTYEFTATDTGCGMSPEFLEHLFEPFARDTGEYAIKAEGTGLGMTITKNIIDLLGGSIKVESEVGVGTTFTVSLPLRQTDVEPARKTSSLALPMTGGKPYEGLRALVVDDDDLSREVLATIVSGLGFEIEEASNGREALAKIEESEANYYAVVLTDMRMPIMDGISFTKAVRALPREDTATLPLIAETADAFEEERRRARAAGMTDFITKPIKINELHEVLESVVDRI